MQKISIKREQSQAGLSFAEREKFRAQVKISIGAVSGASKTAAKRYDLGGRNAKATKKGVVIVDGKKVVIK